MSRSGIVNVRMVITEEKILSNIDKIQKLINPKSKKQIVQLDDDAYFKDLIESVKTYLVEYPKKKNFPPAVYKAAYELVEFATNQFEENTKKIEDLIRQREANIATAAKLKDTLEIISEKEEGWKNTLKEANDIYTEDIVEALTVIGKARSKETQNYEDAIKLVNARIVNLESNLHIEIDMERIEDRSKALSYIGIEIADALKLIPTPVEEVKGEEVQTIVEDTVNSNVGKIVEDDAQNVVEENPAEEVYTQETTFEVKPSLWQRIKESKIGRAIRYAFRVRIVLDVPALPEARDNNN